MNVYIDKDNLLSFLKSRNDSGWDDCLRMLQKQCDVFFNFSKEDIISEEDLLKKETLRDFVKKDLTQGKWCSWKRLESNAKPFPERPVQESIYNASNVDDLQSVYLIDDERVKFMQKDGCLLISSVGEEVKSLATLIPGDDYQFSKNILIKELLSWNETNSYLSPCTDIIIVDRYMFNADDETLKNNIFSLISVLSSKVKNHKINICFITDKEAQNEHVDWPGIISKTKEVVKRRTKAEPFVTIVKMPKKGLPDNLREHDRTIFTNYKYIYSGDTFTYFGHRKEGDKANIITSGRLFSLISFGYRDNQRIGATFISDIQNLINEVRKISNYFIEGDKKSNFLYFS